MAHVVISKRLVAVNAVSGVGTRVLQLSVLVWLQQYLLRRISAEEYAVLPVLLGAMAFAPLMTHVFAGGLARFCVEAYAKGDARRVTEIVSTIFPLVLIVGAVLLVGGGVFALNVNRVLNLDVQRPWEPKLMMAIMVFSFAFRFVTAPFTVGFHIRQKYVTRNLIELSAQVLRIGLLFVLLFGIGTRVLWVVVATTSATVASCLAMVIVSRRLVPEAAFRKDAIRWSIAREVLGFGLWDLLRRIAVVIRHATDPLVLNQLSTSVQVAALHVGSLPRQGVQMVVRTAVEPLMPALTAMHALNKQQALRNAFIRGGRYTLWFTLLFIAPVLVFRHELLGLYLGEEYATYRDAAAVMLLRCAVIPLAGGVTMIGRIAVARGRIKALSIVQLSVELANLGLTLYFVAVLHMGAVGCALAGLLTVGISHVVILWPMGLKMSGASPGGFVRRTLLRGLAPALASSAVALLLREWFAPATWGSVIGLVVAQAALYVAVAVLCSTGYDRENVCRLFRRRYNAANRSPDDEQTSGYGRDASGSPGARRD